MKLLKSIVSLAISLSLAGTMAAANVSAVTYQDAARNNAATNTYVDGDCRITTEEISPTSVIICTYYSGVLTQEDVVNPTTGDIKTTEISQITGQKTVSQSNGHDNIDVSTRMLPSAYSTKYLGGFMAEYGSAPYKTQVNVQCSYTDDVGQTTYTIRNRIGDISTLLTNLISIGFPVFFKTSQLVSVLINAGFTVVNNIITGGFVGTFAAIRTRYTLNCKDLSNNGYTKSLHSEKFFINDVSSKYIGQTFYDGLIPSTYWRQTKFADEVLFSMYDIYNYTLKGWY